MKILDLAKELNITTKELIGYFRDNDMKVSSHMQKATDEMIEMAREHFKTVGPVVENVAEKEPVVEKEVIQKSTKVFKADDEIPCRSVTPWKLNMVGVDKNTVYHWEYFGDIEYVKYRDLQAQRRTDYIMKPKIVIMDMDLYSQWNRELGDNYKYFNGIEYPEEYFDKPDEEFINILKNAPDYVKEVIKVTAVAMVKNENYPSVNKLKYIDDILGTCIKDFI